MPTRLSRRDLLAGSAAAATTAAGASRAVPRPASGEPAPAPPAEPFLYGLNTGTLHGQKLPLPNEAGFG